MKFVSSLIFLISILASLTLVAQSKKNKIVTGTLLDSSIIVSKSLDSSNPSGFLKGATVSIINKKDSTTIGYGLSNANGNFIIKNIPNGSYLLNVTFLGYNQIYQSIDLNGQESAVNAGNVFMKKFEKELEGIVIKASGMMIKGDTTEFNAGEFKTIPNASTEDLLKKLPGLEVDKDGSIKTQGEPVMRILVDGKPFFGNDPKMATKNLPADIIEKIQIIDALSEQSEFSGFDDGNRVRTINIITKKDKKKGLFGKASTAFGNEGRNAHAISGNRINGEEKISFLGQMNNINNQNFSVQDFLGDPEKSNNKNGGGTNVFSGNATGISNTKGGGLNYNNTLATKTKINGSYFYNDIDATNNQDRFRETFVLNDSSLFNTKKVISNNINKTHRANIEIDHMFDSSNTVLIKSNYNNQNTYILSAVSSFTTKGKSVNINQVNSKNIYDYTGDNLYNSILLRHKFKKKGRTISLTVYQSLNSSDRESSNISFNNRYTKGIDTLDQISNSAVESNKTGSYLSYTEPLNTKSQIEFTYSFSNTVGTSDQTAFKLDKFSGKHNISLPNLTNAFENTNIANRGGMNFRRQINPRFNYSAGLGIQQAKLMSNNLTYVSSIRQSFINLFPNFNLQFKKGRSKNLQVTYRGNTQQPNVTQLQDVINNSNILNIKTGNPFLKQEFVNTLSMTYNTSNARRTRNFYFSLNSSQISNKISNTITTNFSQDAILVDGFSLIPGAQYSKPQNLNGAYNVSANANLSLSMKNPKSSINLGTYLFNSKDVNLFNKVKSYTNRYTVAGNIKVSLNLEDWLDLNFSSNSTYNIAKYTISSIQNGNFFGQRFSVEPTFTSKNGWIISNDFDYIINRGNSAAFNQSIPLWNAGIAKLFLKGNLGELRLTAFDILNANRSVSRVVELNYIEDLKTQVLNQYFLLSFTYHLRSFKSSKKSEKVNKKSGKNIQF